jgi:hypothetical protein
LHRATHQIERGSRETILLLSALVFLFSSGVEAQTSKFQTVGAVPTTTEVLDAAERAMGKEAARASIRSVSSVAACHGPKRDYETRMISERSGNLSFQQFFPDHKNIAGILDGRGWQLADNGRYEWTDPIETFVLRSHEFPLIALDLRKRFHDFKTIGRTQFEGHATNQTSMTDELGHSASGYFSLTSHLPLGLTVTNPRAGGPSTIMIQFDGWRLTCGVKLVSHVTIFYGSETWVFDFKSLSVNAADDKAFRIPETTMGASGPK